MVIMEIRVYMELWWIILETLRRLVNVWVGVVVLLVICIQRGRDDERIWIVDGIV